MHRGVDSPAGTEFGQVTQPWRGVVDHLLLSTLQVATGAAGELSSYCVTSSSSSFAITCLSILPPKQPPQGSTGGSRCSCSSPDTSCQRCAPLSSSHPLTVIGQQDLCLPWSSLFVFLYRVSQNIPIETKMSRFRPFQIGSTPRAPGGLTIYAPPGTYLCISVQIHVLAC